MELWNRIKQFFQRGKRELLPEAQEIYRANDDGASYKVTRDDGTELKIWPQLDRSGNQTYEQVYNARTNQMQCIPKFNIYAEEIDEILNPGVLNTSVIIDMDPKLLNNPECLQWLANNMLNRERMPKVINQYRGYAGKLEVGPDFKCDKKIDMGIVETKTKTEKEKARMLREIWKKRGMEEKRRIYEKSKNLTSHYRDSHAEDLSQYTK